MKLELDSAGLRLERGQLLKVRDGAGSTVCALEGAVWITEQNQRRDVVLAPGRCYRLREPGVAIVHALNGSASVALS
jgi:hypothetical protein